MIEIVTQSILVDLLVAELQQIAERRAAIPVLGNVQFARRLPEPPPSSPRRRVPCPQETAARTDPQDPSRATEPAPDRHRRTGASARCECPSAAPAPSNLRCHP